MKSSHLLSDELFEQAIDEIQAGNKFIAYNSGQYLLDKGDMEFFSNIHDANDFAFNNSSDLDHFSTLKANSVMDIYDHFEIVQALTEHPTILSQIKHITMNENNLEYLEKQLKFTGFGEDYKEQLKAKMASGAKEFVLSHETSYGKDNVAVGLQFRKSDNSDMYFFNRYNLMLKNEQHPEPLKQTFYINNNHDNISLKEGYNMMSGRAVHKELQNKEGEKYNAWIQLDFKQTEANGNYKIRPFNDNYGFKLEEVLAKYPIAALKNEDEKKMLIESMQRGNRQSVMFEADGKQTRVFIEAAPQYKSLNFYDEHMKKVLPHELSAKNSQHQEGAKQQVKQNAGDDDDIDGPKKKRGRRQSV